MSIDPDLPEDDLSSAVGAETLLAHDLVKVPLGVISLFALLRLARIRSMLLGRRIHRGPSVAGQRRLLLYLADSTRL
jgi:hypothetical protein